MQLLIQGQILGPGGLWQGVLEGEGGGGGQGGG